MKRIAVLNSKGGVGKTTLSLALSVRASQDFKRVALIDTDPQESTKQIVKLRRHKYPDREGPEVLRGAATIDDAIEGLQSTGWDVVFFDGLPAGLALSEKAAKAVDVVVIPMQPVAFVMMASQAMFELCAEVGVPVLPVFNSVERAGSKMVVAARVQLKRAFGVDAAQTEIVHRMAYQSGANLGLSGPEAHDEKAADEIDRLYVEVMAMIPKRRREGRSG